MITEYLFPVISENDKKLPIYVVTAGPPISKKNEHQRPLNRPNGISDHQLLFTGEGSGVVLFDNKEIPVHQNSLIYHKPNTPQIYRATSDFWETYWITFSQNIFFDILDIDSGVYELDMISPYVDMIHEIQKIENNLEFGAKASAHLYYLLIYLKRELQTSKNYYSTTLKLHPAVEYMNKHFTQPIILQEIASTVNMSEEYFCRLFKSVYKMRPFEYVLQLKIQEAKKLLLLLPNTDVLKIAEMVGYENPSYFSRVFKKIEGISPSDFRKINKNM